MAGTTTSSRRTQRKGSDVQDLIVNFNKLVDDTEAVRAATSSGGVVAVTELMADHATFKVTVDQLETLAEELGADHATFKTAVDQTETLVEELHDDHATFKTVVDALKALLNELQHVAQYAPLGNPGFARNANFDVANANAISYLNNGTLKTLSATTNFDTGTAKVLTADRWGAAVLTVNASGTGVVTWAASDFASEASALGGVAAPAATDTVLGLVTVLTGSGVTWTAGTDALQGGTGGTPATTTTYYNESATTSRFMSNQVSQSTPATLTAAKPASGPATLAASTAITSGPATLSASVPSATAVDTAGDLTAAKIGDTAGTAITV